MFYQDSRPTNIKDCGKADATAISLQSYADVLANAGKILLVVSIVVGIIKGVKEGLDNETALPIIYWIIVWVIVGCLLYSLFMFFSYLLLGYAEVVQNSRVSAELAYYCAEKGTMISGNIDEVRADSKKAESIKEKSQDKRVDVADTFEKKIVTEYIGDDRLVCPYCGKPQMKTRNSCYNCGKAFVKTTDNAIGFKTCPNCGTKLREDTMFCIQCGARQTNTIPKG